MHLCMRVDMSACVCMSQRDTYPVLKKATKQGNFGDIIEISDDELDEETSKEVRAFVEATSKEDALSTMH